MRDYKNKSGFTLVEILVVVAIIAILTTIVIRISAGIENQAKSRLAANTIAILTTALEQFAEFGYNYKDSDFSQLKFPLDCNDFDETDVEGALEKAFALNSGDVDIDDSIVYDPNYSASSVMYFFLEQVPQCRKTLDKIDESFITCEDINGDSVKVTIDFGSGGKDYQWFRIVDPWKMPLRYDYYDETETNIDTINEEKRNFPIITSAGPDRDFNSPGDNIVSGGRR